MNIKQITAVLVALVIAGPAVGANDLLYVRTSTSLITGLVRGTVVTVEHRDYYHGLEPITEVEFVRIGEHDTTEVAAFHEKNRSLNIRGWSWFAGGVGLGVIGFLLGLAESADDLAGVPALVVATGVLLWSVVPLTRRISRGDFYLTLHQAELIAAEYNATLD